MVVGVKACQACRTLSLVCVPAEESLKLATTNVPAPPLSEYVKEAPPPASVTRPLPQRRRRRVRIYAFLPWHARAPGHGMPGPNVAGATGTQPVASATDFGQNPKPMARMCSELTVVVIRSH